MKSRDLLYPIRVIRDIFYLPKIVHKQNKSLKGLEELRSEISDLTSAIQQNSINVEALNVASRSMDDRLVNLRHVVSTSGSKSVSIDAQTTINDTMADDHSLDHFYKVFEDRFRGNEDDIKQRVSEYKPLFDALPDEIHNLPVVDLGCGRGEFLSFAKDSGIKAIGVDMNHDMVTRAKSKGYKVYESDAISYMSDQKTNSLAAITGFHLVEHIPFESLVRLFEECYRVLSPGGFVLFETPNPKNIMVGSNNFYIDPSHIKPIPQELLAFTLETVGFKTEIIAKHPVKDKIENSDPELSEMLLALYGAQDYSVLGKKA